MAAGKENQRRVSTTSSSPPRPAVDLRHREPLESTPATAERLRDGRMPGMSVLVAGSVASCLALIASATWASADDKPTDDPSGKFFQQYCRTCHAGEKPKGDFRVDTLSQTFDDKENREKWLNVVKQLKTGVMPPKDKPRPAADETKSLTDWIDARVAAAEAARHAKQGLAVLRRLNRVEYENTVRDLLQGDVEINDVLPADTVSGGFDTSAEALQFSSTLLANYLEPA